MTTRALQLPSTLALRPTIVNLGYVLSGEALVRMATFCAAVLIARVYGAEVLGAYATALAYLTVGVMVADNGLQTAAIEKISTATTTRSEIVSQLYLSKTILLVLITVPLLLVLSATHLTRQTLLIGSLLAFRTVLQSYSQLNAAILKGLDCMETIGLAQAFHAATLFLGIVAVYLCRSSITFLLIAMIAGQALELAITTDYLRGRTIRAVGVALPDCWTLVKDSAPMGLTFGMANIGVRIDVVFLSWWAPLSQVGQFAAAQSVFVIISVISWLFGSVLLGRLSRIARDQQSLDGYTNRWARLLLFGTVPIAAFGIWLTPLLFRLIFGRGFEAAATVASVLLLATPFLFLNSLFLNRAIALRQKRLYTTAQAGALVLGVLVALVAAPLRSGIAIAIAALAREVSLFVFLFSSSAVRARRAAA